MVNKAFWGKKKVLITGYRGFVGSWLYSVFNLCGTKWYGIDKKPALLPLNMTTSMDMSKSYLDIMQYIEYADPDVIFHFAADPIVRNGYVDPQSMLQNNIMSVVNLYSALHELEYKGLVVNMTTDKVYAPSYSMSMKGYTESDGIGSSDPYGCSKVCADIIGNMFYSLGIWSITVRAGNIYGGGDYGENRLFPHIVANITSPTITLRNPKGVRPYQYILNFLDNLLMVTEGEIRGTHRAVDKSGIWNIGPRKNGVNEQIVKDFIAAWKTIDDSVTIPTISQAPTSEFEEREELQLCCDKLYRIYPHKDVVSYEDSLIQTARTYKAIEAKKSRGAVELYTIARKMHKYAAYIVE